MGYISKATWINGNQIIGSSQNTHTHIQTRRHISIPRFPDALQRVLDIIFWKRENRTFCVFKSCWFLSWYLLKIEFNFIKVVNDNNIGDWFHQTPIIERLDGLSICCSLQNLLKKIPRKWIRRTRSAFKKIYRRRYTIYKKDLNHATQFIMTIACLKKNYKRSFLFISYYLHAL